MTDSDPEINLSDDTPVLPEPETPEVDLSDTLDALKTINQDMVNAMKPLTDALNNAQKGFMEMQGPTVDSELEQLEDVIQNVNTDEELEEIKEHISIIRSLESVSGSNNDEVTLELPEGAPSEYEMIDGGMMVGMTREDYRPGTGFGVEVVIEDD